MIPEIGINIAGGVFASGVRKENFVEYILFWIGDAWKVQTEGDYEKKQREQDVHSGKRPPPLLDHQPA